MIDKRLRSVALLVAACFFMETLDGTIVVTAIPQMSASLGVPPSSTALVITAYLLTLAILIPLSGWMVARFGPRWIFPRRRPGRRRRWTGSASRSRAARWAP